MNQSGIYEIVCMPTGKRYVGSALCARARFNMHRSQLRKGTHHSQMLQRAWGKYGEAAFKFTPLFVRLKEDLVFYEQRTIDTLQPVFNMLRMAGNSLGSKRTPEQVANIKAGLAASRAKRLPYTGQSYELDGVSYTVPEAALVFGINKYTLWDRLNRCGRTFEEAINSTLHSGKGQFR